MPITTYPYPGVLTPVAWCRCCRMWADAGDIGGECPNCDGTCKLVRREGYLCGRGGIHRTEKAATRCRASHEE
jgi:hypothetical protein